MYTEQKLDLSLSLLTQDSSNLEAEKQEKIVQILSQSMEGINKDRQKKMQQSTRKYKEELKENTEERNRSFPNILSGGAGAIFVATILFFMIRKFWNPLHITIPLFFAIGGGLVGLACLGVCIKACFCKVKIKTIHNIEMQDINDNDIEAQTSLSKAYVEPVIVSKLTSSEKNISNEAAQSLLKNVDFQDTDVSNNKFMFDGYRNGTTSIEPKISNTPNSQQHQEEESLIKFEN